MRAGAAAAGAAAAMGGVSDWRVIPVKVPPPSAAVSYLAQGSVQSSERRGAGPEDAVGLPFCDPTGDPKTSASGHREDGEPVVGRVIARGARIR